LDADGRITDVRRGQAPPGWTRRFPAYAATVHYNGRGVPAHICYDTAAQNHPLDATFCHKTKKVDTHG
jgi:hypothetical protein